jgi:hypothetical protein
MTAPTISRGLTVLHPDAVLGWSLTRAARSVVHEILGTAQVEITVRQPGPRAGTLVTLWWTEATARAAFDALSVAGAPWVWAVPDALGAPLTAHVLDGSLEAAEDAGRRWIIRSTVQEIGT